MSKYAVSINGDTNIPRDVNFGAITLPGDIINSSAFSAGRQPVCFQRVIITSSLRDMMQILLPFGLLIMETRPPKGNGSDRKTKRNSSAVEGKEIYS